MHILHIFWLRFEKIHVCRPHLFWFRFEEDLCDICIPHIFLAKIRRRHMWHVYTLNILGSDSKITLVRIWGVGPWLGLKVVHGSLLAQDSAHQTVIGCPYSFRKGNLLDNEKMIAVLLSEILQGEKFWPGWAKIWATMPPKTPPFWIQIYPIEKSNLYMSKFQVVKIWTCHRVTLPWPSWPSEPNS